MRWQLIIPLVIYFPILLIQLTLVPLVSIDEIIPDLILILLVYYTITYGQIYGTILGGVFGILFDLITGSLLGSAMLSKTVVGFLAGYFSSETRRDQYLNTYSFTFVVFLCSIADTILYSFFSAWDFNINIFRLLFNYSLLPSIYTAIVSLIIVIIPHKRSFD